MSLLGELLSEARKANIGYGIHDNVVITAVSNDQRKNKDNEKINRNTYIKFGKLNDKGAIVAEKEVNWFNLDGSNEYAAGNFISQLEQLSYIAGIYVGMEDDSKWNTAVVKVFDACEIDLPEGTEPEQVDTWRDEVLKVELKDKETCKDLIQGLGDAFCKLVSKKIGKESQPMRFKVTYDKSGKYLQQPRYGSFVESMEVEAEDTRLRLTSADEENRQKSLVTSAKPKTPVGKL
jgi:hypothetical protein